MARCKICRQEFRKVSMTQKVCSPDCAEKFAVLERCKAQKKERIEKLKRMKPRAQHMREALAAFNAWIRERDKDEPCISDRKSTRLNSSHT